MASSLKNTRRRIAVKLLAEKYHLADAFSAAADIERIFSGEPLDYVIGWTPFLGLSIDLSLRPFIPRPETEYWTAEAIKNLQERAGRTLRVLDIFAGSGCIGSAVLKYVPASHVTFAEKIPRFVEQIKINLRKNGLSSGRCRVLRSDFFSHVEGRFDAILANPPYVASLRHLDEGVKKYEPREAYYGGTDGLSAIRRFLKDARFFLKTGGEIWMEFDSPEINSVRDALRRFGYSQFSFRRDQYGRPRYVVIKV